MASEHLSHNIPHIPCHWEALKQPHSSRHPWEGDRLPGMAQLGWIVLAWVPDPDLLAQLLAPSPSSSSPSLSHPNPSHPPLHLCSSFPCSRTTPRTQPSFPLFPTAWEIQERRLGVLLLRGKERTVAFWRGKVSKLFLFLSPPAFHWSYQSSSLQTCSV